MALEDAINKLADAITHHANVLSGLPAAAAAAGGAKSTRARPANPGADSTLPGAPGPGPTAGAGPGPGGGPQAAPGAAAGPGAQPAGAGAATPANGIKYEWLRAGFSRVGEVKGNAAAIALLTALGVKNGKEVKVDAYPRFKELIAAQLDATEQAKLELFK